jgi:cytidylate kinase
MPVIAMTREMGSRGKDVALGLAQELGLKLVQHEIVENVAEKTQLVKSAVNRFLEGEAGLLERWGIDEDSISLYTAEEILEFAESGNVLIRGWGAACLLRPVGHVVSVRVCAPLEYRMKVLMERLDIYDEAFARAEIEKNDSAHARALHRLFQVDDWRDPLLYDICLNTGQVPVAECIAQVKRLALSPSFQETAESRKQLANIRLEMRIRRALKDNPEIAETGSVVDVIINSDSGAVTLRGGVYSERELRLIEEIVRTMPEIRKINNELKVVKVYLGMGT